MNNVAFSWCTGTVNTYALMNINDATMHGNDEIEPRSIAHDAIKSDGGNNAVTTHSN